MQDLHEDLLDVRDQQILSALKKFEPIDHRGMNNEMIPLNEKKVNDPNNETTESEDSSEHIQEVEI